VRRASGAELTDALAEDIKQRLRTECSPRHVPAVICAVDRTAGAPRSGQAGRAGGGRRRGRPPDSNTDGLENPEVLAAIAGLDALTR